ncbi:MAG TPA: STAS domain-containing protein [Bacteroidales bacterium]|nr:STAS domain-containing protein [Bacteroidales bacterium]
MISIDKTGGIERVTFNVDRIDALITEDIKEGIMKSFDTPRAKVIIDLKGVQYIDSSGFGSFLALLKTARNNYGTIKFANPEPRIMETIRTLHLHTLFQIYDDIESCIESFN